MKKTGSIPTKIFTLEQLLRSIARWRFLGKSLSFTNGCFDLLHEGNIASLSQAASEGDILIIGLNSDASTKRLKGKERPVNNENSRALLLASMAIVDAVVIFEEDTPFNLVTAIMPDVMVKGGDYTVDEIEGAKEVIANGGRVVINPIVEGFSSTRIIEQIKKIANKKA
jgi:D-beta-D-heptose 7-phosphate kinase/D-beta-D-heptose 1-phosphate adenosyltransferase